MTEFNQPIVDKRKVGKAFLAALLLGTIVLVTAVLPAEYGIDPIGTGTLFGFGSLHQSDSIIRVMVQTQPEANREILKLENAGSDPKIKKPKETDNPPPVNQIVEREDTIRITIPAGKGLEYKVYLLKYGTMKYEWITDEGVLFFDFHGEVNEANPPKDLFYQSHTVAYSNNMIGTFLSPFEGRHGWYFKNSATQDMYVTIRLKGEYRLVD